MNYRPATNQGKADLLAEVRRLNDEVGGVYDRLQAAHELLRDLHRELEDRGGSLTRKTWNRLETYVEPLSDTEGDSNAREHRTR